MLIFFETNIYCILTKETIIWTNDLWATPVSMASAFNFVEGFAVLAARFYGFAVSRYAVSMFNFVEGYAVHVSVASPFLAARFECLRRLRV